MAGVARSGSGPPGAGHGPAGPGMGRMCQRRDDRGRGRAGSRVACAATGRSGRRTGRGPRLGAWDWSIAFGRAGVRPPPAPPRRTGRLPLEISPNVDGWCMFPKLIRSNAARYVHSVQSPQSPSGFRNVPFHSCLSFLTGRLPLEISPNVDGWCMFPKLIRSNAARYVHSVQSPQSPSGFRNVPFHSSLFLPLSFLLSFLTVPFHS